MRLQKIVLMKKKKFNNTFITDIDDDNDHDNEKLT